MIEILFILVIGYVVWVLYPEASQHYIGADSGSAEDETLFIIIDNRKKDA